MISPTKNVTTPERVGKVTECFGSGTEIEAKDQATALDQHASEEALNALLRTGPNAYSFLKRWKWIGQTATGVNQYNAYARFDLFVDTLLKNLGDGLIEPGKRISLSEMVETKPPKILTNFQSAFHESWDTEKLEPLYYWRLNTLEAWTELGHLAEYWVRFSEHRLTDGLRETIKQSLIEKGRAHPEWISSHTVLNEETIRQRQAQISGAFFDSLLVALEPGPGAQFAAIDRYDEAKSLVADTQRWIDANLW